MQNYYEILGLSISASSNEIEEAIDQEYGKWRQLVTHHDSKVVAQANANLEQLEKIRSILLDEVRRNLYDKSLGSDGNIHGLNDPDTYQQNIGSSSFAAPLSQRKQTEKPGMERTDAWICSQCQKANPIGTVFCQKCGKKIAAPCANCGNVSEVENLFCSVCGKNKKEVFDECKENELNSLIKEKEKLQKTKSAVTAGDYTDVFALSSFQKGMRSGWWFIGVFLLIAFMFLIISASNGGIGVGAWIGFAFFGGFGLYALVANIRDISRFSNNKNEFIQSYTSDISQNEKEINRLSKMEYENGDKI